MTPCVRLAQDGFSTLGTGGRETLEEAETLIAVFFRPSSPWGYDPNGQKKVSQDDKRGKEPIVEGRHVAGPTCMSLS